MAGESPAALLSPDLTPSIPSARGARKREEDKHAIFNDSNLSGLLSRQVPKQWDFIIHRQPKKAPMNKPGGLGGRTAKSDLVPLIRYIGRMQKELKV